MSSPDRYVNAHEIAGLLGVPVSWVREHTRTGDVPHRRFGRYVRYAPDEVRAWAEEQSVGTARKGRT